MMSTKHTPGPLRVIPHEKKPWVLQTIDNDGNVVHERFLPYFSAKDKTFNDVMSCTNFPAPWSKEATPTYNSDYCSELNRRAYADEILRAAAPEMYEEVLRLRVINAEMLEALKHIVKYGILSSKGLKMANAAIAKAKG